MSAPNAGLHLFARCGAWVLALSADPLERVLTAGDERFIAPADDAPKGVGLGRALVVDGTCYGAWDLGLLLGLGEQAGAWALLRLATPSGALPIALRLGACLDVGPLPPLTPLPRGLFAARAAALDGAFRSARPPAGVEPLGLHLQVGRLWSEAELEGTRALVEAAQRERRRGLARAPLPPEPQRGQS